MSNINDRVLITIEKRSLILKTSAITLKFTCALWVSIHKTSKRQVLETYKQFKILKTVLEETSYLLAIEEIEYNSLNSATIAKTSLLVIV